MTPREHERPRGDRDDLLARVEGGPLLLCVLAVTPAEGGLGEGLRHQRSAALGIGTGQREPGVDDELRVEALAVFPLSTVIGEVMLTCEHNAWGLT